MRYSEATKLIKAALAAQFTQTSPGSILKSKKLERLLKVLQKASLLTTKTTSKTHRISIKPSSDLLGIKIYGVPVSYSKLTRAKVVGNLVNSDYEALITSTSQGLELHPQSNPSLGGLILGKVFSSKKLSSRNILVKSLIP